MFETEFLAGVGKSQTTYRDAIAHAVEILCDAYPNQPPQLALVAEPQLSTVVFRYTLKAEGADADALNLAIRRNLFERGEAVIGHTRVLDRQCLKLTCMNPRVSDEEMEKLIRMIVAEGQAIEQHS